MAGLITDAMSGAKKDPTLGQDVYSAGSTGVDPALRTIDPAKETVQGQLTGLMSQENPLMTKARTNAAQTANARGLLNSSMAAGAGEEAAINTALPIANADASIYGTASRDNQAATNTGLQFNAGAKNNAALTDASAANQSASIAKTGAETRLTQQQAAANESALFEKQAAQQTNIQQLQANSAKELANIEAQYKTQMQGNASAGQVMAAAQAGINDILKDTTLSNDAKAALVKQIHSGLKAEMGVIGAMSGMDLSSLLVFPEAAAPTPPAGTPAGTPAAGAPVTAATPGAVQSPFGNYYIPGATPDPTGNPNQLGNQQYPNWINATGGRYGG